MIRAVYDTSALVIIFARRGEILKFKNNVIKQRLKSITSDYILNELEEVLCVKFKFTRQKSKSHTRLFARVATIVKVSYIKVASRDPKDDPILATAVSGKAQYIVTLDDDLLTLKEHEGIQIITPSAFDIILESEDKD